MGRPAFFRGDTPEDLGTEEHEALPPREPPPVAQSNNIQARYTTGTPEGMGPALSPLSISHDHSNDRLSYR